MTTLLLTIGIPIGYLLVGAIYARSQAARLYKAAKNEWGYEDMVRETLFWMIAWRIPFWPLSIVLDAIRGPLRAWFMSPITDRKERAEKLREDAKWQAEFARQQTDPEVRRVINDYAAELKRKAEEVDL